MAPLFTLPPTCQPWSPTGRSQPWYLCQGKSCCYAIYQPSTWGNQRGARSYHFLASIKCSHKANEGHPISPHALISARCHDPLRGSLAGGDLTFTYKVGSISTTKLEAPDKPRSF